MALIEYAMYVSARKYAISNIIDIIQSRHYLAVFWSILYNLLKLLE